MKLKTLKDIQKHEIPGYGKASCIFISKLEEMIKDHIEYLKQPTETSIRREIHDIRIGCLQLIFNMEPTSEPKTIHFAHHYLKLHDIDPSEPVALIQVLPMHIRELSDEFIHYDTLWFRNGQPKTSIPDYTFNGKTLVLIFEQDGKMFTSIKKATPNNIDKYTTSIGCDFKIKYP